MKKKKERNEKEINKIKQKRYTCIKKKKDTKKKIGNLKV